MTLTQTVLLVTDGEPGLEGWTIFVDYDNDRILDEDEPSGVTTADGSYTITGITPGTWHVREIPQEEHWTNSFPEEGSYLVTFESGATLTALDFGNWTTATASGIKYHDLNANGQRDDDEPGLEGWTIFLDCNDNGILDDNEAFAETGPGGLFVITGIQPGTCRLREIPRDGWMNSEPEDGFYLLTFQSGDAVTDLEVGNWTTASIIDSYKFNDLDADGLAREEGESGLEGWTIFVDYDGNGVLDIGEPSAVTGEDGSYTITGITPGTWHVREVPQEGWINSFPEEGSYLLTFESAAIVTDVDFGNWTTARIIESYKFNDLNADGLAREDGEPGLAGWTIFVDYDNNGVHDEGEPSAVTTDDGSYTITGITPGTWHVRELPQEGWTNSFPEGGSYLVTFESAATLTDLDFGNWTTARIIESYKFNDLNADGLAREDGEPGLAGWTIFVDYDNNGVHDEGEPSAVTTDDGSYTITGITPGTWHVRELPQEGWTNSFPEGGSYLVTFESAATLTDLDFGNWTTARIIESYKFNDLNADGLAREDGEPGLAGWTIFVDYDNNGVHDEGEPSAVTTDDGSYTITGITPGTWHVRELPQEGWTNSFPEGGSYLVTFESAATLTDLDFGNWTTASIIESFKFNDLDADGLPREDGEPGLSGWTIFVDYNNDSTLDDGEPSAITTADGSYTITGITPGTWHVREVPQENWTNSFPGTGSHLVTFESDATLTGLDFGNWTTASIIESFKFNDLDADGSPREDGEPGLSGWTIFVDYNNDSILDDGEPSAITTADGGYTITGITPGTWHVREVPQENWTNSFPEARSYLITFESAATLTGLDFGNWTTARIIESSKFNDLDADGLPREDGEPGLSGWTIFVDYNNDSTLDDGEPSAVTTADGSYTITGITPGTWHVREVPQVDWTNSFPELGSYLLTFESAATLTDLDFGNYSQPQIIQFITPLSVYRTVGPFVRPPDFQLAMAGFVWHDQNADGAWDAGEPGINGVTVYLDLNNSGSFELAEDLNFPTVNDGSHDGAFWFEEDQFATLPSGDYFLRVDLPPEQDPRFPGAPDFAHSVTIEAGMFVMGRFEQAETPNFGLEVDFVSQPPGSVATIRGYKWHDVDQDGVWDTNEPGRAGWRVYLDLNNDNAWDPQTEPRTLTSTDGSYIFSNLTPDTYTIRELETDLSGGTFSVQRFPGPAPSRDPDEHRVTVTGGQVLEGRTGVAEEPNFGSFEYSPFTRPANDLVGHLDTDWDGTIDLAEQEANAELLTGLNATGWHSFHITNNTGTDFNIDHIERNIDVSQIGVADQFVTVFWRDDGENLVRVVPPPESSVSPILVADGETAEFLAFYDPAIRIREEHTVEEQYPEWYDDPDTTENEQETRPAHTFVPGDHLNVLTDTDLSFRIDLVGGSTYDSDITYDGAVNFQDLFWINDLLDIGWPTVDTTIQEVRIDGVNLAGTFTFSFEGQTTESIPWNASNEEVEAALERLDNVADVRVANPLIDNGDSDWLILFMNPGGDQVPLVVLDTSGVMGTTVNGDVIPVASRFDLTSDVNARHPDGAGLETGMLGWPIDGLPRREIGLGDLGPLSVEFFRVRSPLLDLDTDNSSGALGTGYVVDYAEPSVPIAKYESRAVISQNVPDFSSLSAEVAEGATAGQLEIDEALLPDDITVTGNGTPSLQLSGTAPIEDYTSWLREITFSTRPPR